MNYANFVHKLSYMIPSNRADRLGQATHTQAVIKGGLSLCAHRGGRLLVLSLNPSTDWLSYVRKVFLIPVLSLTCDVCVSHTSQGKEGRQLSSLWLLVGFRLLSRPCSSDRIVLVSLGLFSSSILMTLFIFKST